MVKIYELLISMLDFTLRQIFYYMYLGIISVSAKASHAVDYFIKVLDPDIRKQPDHLLLYFKAKI